jgi:hypothetical protein
MKTTTLKVTLAGVILSVLSSLTPIATAAELTLVPPESVPTGGTFFYGSQLETDAPPYPANLLCPECPVYRMDEDTFLVDDSSQQQLVTMGEGGMMESNSMEPPCEECGTNEWSGFQFTPPVYASNDLWLEITLKTNSTGYFVAHPAWDELNNSFDVFATTNLTAEGTGLNATNWVWILRTIGGVTNFTSSDLIDETRFYRLARTNDADGDGLSDAMESIWSHTLVSNSDQNSNSIPDGWEWSHFGNLNQTAGGDFDGDGVSNLSEYYNGTDPNSITFSIVITNEFINAVSSIVPLNVITGVPSSMAVIVDSTNFAAASWSASTLSNATVSLPSEGWHDVWIGLRGRVTTSQQTWKWVRLKRDMLPPVLVITNPTASAIVQPMIQVQGHASESLSSIFYDLTNSLGVATNKRAFVLSQNFNTNVWEFGSNYFQAFDISVAMGTNVITLRATDQAGNTAVTNLTFVLDYSGKTNPPAINLFCPKNGSQISASSFTWRGWIDDFTGSVTASTVSTNGTTNVYSGIVERDGEFWIENLPLSTGTNNFQLRATDAAGNFMVTNVAVVKSSVSLAISSYYEPPPDHPITTVNGTIGSTNYSVWVNGVKAQINGSSWTATNVPIPAGGTFVFRARAISNSDNDGNGSGGSGGGGGSVSSADKVPANPESPNAPDTELQVEKPAQVFMASYTYSYHGSPYMASKERHEDYDSAGNLTSWTDSQVWVDNDLHWEHRSPASNTRSTFSDYDATAGHSGPFSCSFQTSWPVPGWEIFFHWYSAIGSVSQYCEEPYGTNQSSYTVEGVPTWGNTCNQQSIVDNESWTYNGSGWHHYKMRWQFTRKMQHTLKLFTGGKSIPGAKSLFSISASAAENLWKNPPDDQINSPTTGWIYYRERRQISPQEISIESVGNLGSDGVRLVALPPGQTFPVTAQVKAVDYYDSGTGAAKKEPKIYFNGQNVTGSNVTVVAGEKINLTCVLDGTSPTLPANGTCIWTIPGIAISNYIANVNAGTVYTNFATTRSNVVFYWVDGGTKEVTVEIGEPAAVGKVTFTVQRPNIQITATVPGEIRADNNYAVAGTFLHFGGNPVGTNMTPGIKFEILSTDIDGEAFFIQTGHASETNMAVNGD